MELPKDTPQATWTGVREWAAWAKARLQVWWLKILRRKWMILAVIAALGVLCWLLLPWLYSMPWTGFGDDLWYKSDALEYRRYKTLWDWLGLLIIPAMLFGGGIWFTHWREKRDREIEQQRREEESRLESDRLREEALQGYLDRMTELMLDKSLCESKAGDPARDVARSLTLLVSRRLDGKRKGLLLKFLRDSGLIFKDQVSVRVRGSDLIIVRNELIVRLQGADLRDLDLSDLSDIRDEFHLEEVDLGGVDLRGANLAGVFFTRADLNHADLRGADLTCAACTDANFFGAQLGRANLTSARLDRAEFPGADLSGAQLCGAQLSGADLSSVQGLTQQQVDSAGGDAKTQLPWGLKRPASWTPGPPSP